MNVWFVPVTIPGESAARLLWLRDLDEKETPHFAGLLGRSPEPHNGTGKTGTDILEHGANREPRD